jgi:hypothetical protein
VLKELAFCPRSSFTQTVFKSWSFGDFRNLARIESIRSLSSHLDNTIVCVFVVLLLLSDLTFGTLKFVEGLPLQGGRGRLG